MRKILVPLLTVGFAILAANFWFMLMETYFGLPFLRLLSTWPQYCWKINYYEHSWVIGIVLCLATLMGACVGAFNIPKFVIPIVLGVGSIVGTIVHIITPLEHQLIFNNLPNHLSPTFLIFMYLTISAVFTFSGLLGGKVWRWDLDNLAKAEKNAKESATPQHHGKYNLGFSIVEILVVVVIIAILAAILLPVLARSRRAAYQTVDTSNLKQIYAAVVLYEQDNNGQSPENLLQLIPKYAPAKIFYSKLDPRGTGNGTQWPENLFLTPFSDGSDATLFGNYPISFAYLRPFWHRFHPGDTWEKYRNDPKVGMLVDTQLEFREPIQYLNSRYGPNEPATNFLRFLVCRMDGSITQRQVPAEPNDCTGETYEIMFLFWPINCGPTGLSG